jgi:hypothetical protein
MFNNPQLIKACSGIFQIILALDPDSITDPGTLSKTDLTEAENMRQLIKNMQNEIQNRRYHISPGQICLVYMYCFGKVYHMTKHIIGNTIYLCFSIEDVSSIINHPELYQC